MKIIFIIIIILATLLTVSCNNNPSKNNSSFSPNPNSSSNLNTINITLDSLCSFNISLSPNYKLINKHSDIIILDTVNNKEAEISTIQDWVVERNGLKFETFNFKEFVEKRVVNEYSFDDIGYINVKSMIDNYSEFNNVYGIKIYKTGVVYETMTEDSAVTVTRYPSIYIIEIPNVKLREKDKNYIQERGLEFSGDSVVINETIKYFKYL